MPFLPDSDYWLQIPAGRYRVGLVPDEAKRIAEHSAAWAKEQGVDLTPNEGKMIRQAAVMLDTTANVRWVEEYLLAHYPAREVELGAFAIARRPVITREFKQFMAETGETDGPRSWNRTKENLEDDRPVSGLSWNQAAAFAAWAGARLPFEDEWERAVRGPDHLLYPWGNEHAPLGPKILKDYYPVVLPSSTTRTPDGLLGAVSGRDEWCADLWSGPGIDDAKWEEQPALTWGRVLRGGTALKKVVPCNVYRSSGDPYSLMNELASIRLVRADDRQMPGDHPSAPPERKAQVEVRRFEARILNRAYENLKTSAVARLHSLSVDWSGYIRDVPGAGKVALAIMRDDDGIRAGIPSGEGKWAFGLFLAAGSKESVRRIPKEHGIFVYNVQYRLAKDGTVRARPVVAYRMAFDRSIHRFENRFRPNEIDTPISEITEEMVRASILDAFQFYEIHADSDEDPFASS